MAWGAVFYIFLSALSWKGLCEALKASARLELGQKRTCVAPTKRAT